MSPETLLQLSLVILFLPLLSFLALLAFGKRLPRQGDWLATGILLVVLILSFVVMFAKLGILSGPIPGFPSAPIQGNMTWIDLKSVVYVLGHPVPLTVELGVMIDNLTAVMLVVVSMISFLVHFFSIGYMHGDAKYSRYFAYLGLFSFSMLGIVITNNLLMMYVFWELVGLSSYLLIGFWYENAGPAYASKKAFIVNRIGDVGMFIGILILFTNFASFRFDAIFAHIGAGHLPYGSPWWLTAGGILIFCGAVGKSAQFPLHTWLPDAMEGPTPVSALIHAATMVAAGVYLVARVFPMLTGEALLVIALIGALTAFISATIAIAQNDIKKVLAYSTVSQLGYMVMALGVGAYTAGVFHLATHAMFKACLFLGSGSVIHAMHHALHHVKDHETDAQDIRNMGGLGKKMPVTFATFLVATLAISGVPLFSGFLSKDEILAGTWALGGLKGGIAQIIPWVGFGVAALTAFYMFRLVILTFLGEPKRPEVFAHVRESGFTMVLPLVVLAVLSTWIWFAFNPFGGSTGWFMQSVKTPATVTAQQWYDFGERHALPEHLAAPGAGEAAPPAEAAPPEAAGASRQKELEHAIHAAHVPAMITSLIVAGLGILFAFLVYRKKLVDPDRVAARLRPVYLFLLNKWYFDEIYEKWIVVPFVLLTTRLLNWFDTYIVDGAVNGAAKITVVASAVSGWIDKYIVDGLVNLTAYGAGFLGLVFRKFQTGRVQTYIVFVVIGIVVLFYVFY